MLILVKHIFGDPHLNHHDETVQMKVTIMVSSRNKKKYSEVSSNTVSYLELSCHFRDSSGSMELCFQGLISCADAQLLKNLLTWRTAITVAGTKEAFF